MKKIIAFLVLNSCLVHADPASFEDEIYVFKTLTSNAEILFDVGANMGNWTSAALTHCPDANVYLFEPTPNIYQYVFNKFINNRNVFCYEIAINQNDMNCASFHVWNSPNLIDFGGNSIHYRSLAFLFNRKRKKPTVIQVATQSIDGFCKRNQIDYIDYMKIDVEGSERDVLIGSIELLDKQAIKYIQFEYGSTFRDAKSSLKEIYELLTCKNYKIYRLLSGGSLEHQPLWKDELEDYSYNIYLASTINL